MTLLCGDCVEIMGAMRPDSINLTITSPPYDDMRTYNGYRFDATATIEALYRVTAQGGVVVWVVGDQTVNGSESGSSHRHALTFLNVGFRLETMIYEKAGTGACGSQHSYAQAFEYMFVAAKGRPATSNLLRDRMNIRAGAVCTRGRISITGQPKDTRRRTVPERSVRTNVWRYAPGNNGDDKAKHPAPMPERLVLDHLVSWSRPGDLIFDPFAGSGTTAKVAFVNGRRFIGCDVSLGYLAVARQRAYQQPSLFRAQEARQHAAAS